MEAVEVVAHAATYNDDIRLVNGHKLNKALREIVCDAVPDLWIGDICGLFAVALDDGVARREAFPFDPFTLELKRHMADLTVGNSRHNLAVVDQSSANASTNGDIQYFFIGRQQHRLRQAAQFGVVFQQNWAAKNVLSICLERLVDPRQIS